MEGCLQKRASLGPAGIFFQADLTSDFVTLLPKSLLYKYAWMDDSLKTLEMAG